MKKPTVETMETGELKNVFFTLSGLAYGELSYEEQQLLKIIADELVKRSAI